MSFQICNVHHVPQLNSPVTTPPVFEGKSMTLGLKRGGKLFISGNIMSGWFLCLMFGLSGASGTTYFNQLCVLLHETLSVVPCMWCHVTSSELVECRTTSGDYYRFQAAGGNLKKAKEFHNCIRDLKVSL